MNLLNLFLRRSTAYLLLLSIFSSLVNTGILVFISTMISGNGASLFGDNNWIAFAGLIAASFIINLTFQLRLIRLTNGILYEFEVNVLDRLKAASYQHFETLGKERVYTAINDTRVLTTTPATVIDAINAFIKITCCLVYMCYISFVAGMFVITVISILLLIYILRNKKVEESMNIVREKQNHYYRYLHDLLEGFKEIRMDSWRNENMFTRFLKKNLFERNRLNIFASIRYLNNELAGGHSWFLLIGIILFGLPGLFLLDTDKTITFIVSVLYIMGPVSVIIGLIPFHTRVKIALSRLKEFNQALSVDAVSSEGEKPSTAFDCFKSIRFEQVAFEYFDSQLQKTFVLGPVSLSVTKGELVFITGGNGSGKSTFIMLLTGLYKPISGSIYFNDHKIGPENYDHYTDRISAVFTDSHTFSENYNNFELRTDNVELNTYLEVMNLKEVLSVRDGYYDLNTRLSKGQEKRMALILALLEKRPVLVLDEWAAQQDVKYRAFFYETLLPSLKEEGKTIIAVTHDERYYTCADRIIRFEVGKIISDARIENVELVH